MHIEDEYGRLRRHKVSPMSPDFLLPIFPTGQPPSRQAILILGASEATAKQVKKRHDYQGHLAGLLD